MKPLYFPRAYCRFLHIRLVNSRNKKRTDQVSCLNCKTVFTGNFCGHCGQKRETGRLTFRSVMSNFWGGLTNIEHGFFYTLAALFLCPGKIIRDYIAGRRVYYTNPFQLLFILAAVYTFIYTLLHYQNATLQIEMYTDVYRDVIKTPLGKWLTESRWMEQASIFIIKLYNSNKAFQLLCGLPFYAIATRIIFRKRATYNTTEYSFLVGYISCIILSISLLFLWFPSAGSYTTLTLIELIVLPVVYYRFFGGKPWITLLQVIGMYILASGLILLSAVLLGLLIATVINITGLLTS